MNSPIDLTLQIVLTVVAGIGAQVLSAFLQIPGIALLLLFGILLGPSVLGWVQPDRLGNGLEVIVALLVAIVLFDGGFGLQLRELSKVSTSLRNLITVGFLLNFIGGSVAAHYLSEFPWGIACLFGALVVVTGPVTINSILKQVKVDRSVATILEGEGVLIDPIGAILAVAILNLILNDNLNPLALFADLAVRLGVGTAIGSLGGWLIGQVLQRSTFLSDDLKTLVVLAGVWGLFGSAQALQSEAGLLAAVVAGVFLRTQELSEERLLKRFKGQLTILSVSVLFILLAADLPIASLFALGWEGVVTVLFLIFWVRPIYVWLCTRKSALNWRQKVFIAWIAPRGIVSASIASLFAILLTQRGINGGEAIKALVFLTILITVFLQALTAPWLANWLGITSSQATGIVILGANPISMLVARLFLEQGEFVAIITPDANLVTLEPQENLEVAVSAAIDNEILARVGLGEMGSFLALTENSDVNAVAAQRALEEFAPFRVAAAIPSDSTTAVKPAFDSKFDYKIWSDYLQDGAVRLGQTQIVDLARQLEHLRSLVETTMLLPLIIERAGKCLIFSSGWEWEIDDRLIYLLYEPKPKLLKLLAGGSQNLLSIETIPEVENLPVVESEEVASIVPQPPL
jgi:NhaP-type Na+/H+ or K+/H+ antiporter